MFWNCGELFEGSPESVIACWFFRLQFDTDFQFRKFLEVGLQNTFHSRYNQVMSYQNGTHIRASSTFSHLFKSP